jgi:hypothetical protein
MQKQEITIRVRKIMATPKIKPNLKVSIFLTQAAGPNVRRIIRAKNSGL